MALADSHLAHARAARPPDKTTRCSPASPAISSVCSFCLERDSARITALAETLRRTVRAPITFRRSRMLRPARSAWRSATEPQSADERLKDAELAMYHASAMAATRSTSTKPAMRAHKSDRLTIAVVRHRAIEARRNHYPLPADRAARGSRGRGLRGAGALEPSSLAAHVAARIHQHRRGKQA